MDAVTDFSANFDNCDFFFNMVSSKQAGATHYTLMRVCCDPTQVGDNCNAMTDAVINSLWLGLPGGPADVAGLVGNVYGTPVLDPPPRSKRSPLPLELATALATTLTQLLPPAPPQPTAPAPLRLASLAPPSGALC